MRLVVPPTAVDDSKRVKTLDSKTLNSPNHRATQTRIPHEDLDAEVCPLERVQDVPVAGHFEHESPTEPRNWSANAWRTFDTPLSVYTKASLSVDVAVICSSNTLHTARCLRGTPRNMWANLVETRNTQTEAALWMLKKEVVVAGNALHDPGATDEKPTQEGGVG